MQDRGYCGGVATMDADRYRWVLPWILVAACAALCTARADASDDEDSTEQPEMPEFVDFERLERPNSPNHWLTAPSARIPELQADAPAPRFRVNAARLAEVWVDVVRRQPRTRILGVSEDRLQIEAEQRSAVFGFVDRISFRAVALGAAESTLLAYSRSRVGYWDLGVNRRRLSDWVGALQSALGEGPGSGGWPR
jgi:uncharacterized protein (DUF1499 family)